MHNPRRHWDWYSRSARPDRLGLGHRSAPPHWGAKMMSRSGGPQFEREVIGERVRDKIAASKKKRIWMGGMPPLGYDVKERRLVVNDTEARTVGDIYRRYLALKSVRALADERLA